MALLVLLALPALAGTPAGYSEYIIPFDEDIFAFVTDPVTGGTIGAGDTTFTLVSITAWSDTVTIYYDHWEDGYDYDPNNPDGPGTDEKYTLDKGQTLNFQSLTVPRPRTGADGNTYRAGAPPGGANCTAQPTPGTALIRTTPNYCYDGRDRIISVGGATTVTRGGYLNTAGIGKLAAIGEEVYPLAPQLIKYILPFGEDVARNDYERVLAVIQATEDDTSIQIDFNGDGVFDAFNTENGYRTTRADPVDATTLTLQRGQSYVLDRDSDGMGGTLNKGTIVLGTKTLQVEYFYGQTDSTYNTRAVSAYPRGFWTNEYYASADGPAGALCDTSYSCNTDILLYNPSTSSITINWETTAGSGTFNLAGNETGFFQAKTGGGASNYVPQGSGVYLRGTGVFWGISDVDSNGQNWDWGYSLVPSYLLSDDQTVAWAPGNSPAGACSTAGNRSTGLFVTPALDNTTFFIDANGDGTPDTNASIEVLRGSTAVVATGSGYKANRLESLYITGSNSGTGAGSTCDLTGARIYATGPFSMSFGENPDKVGIAGGLDLGYTVLPSPANWMDLALTVDKATSPVLVSTLAGVTTVTYTLVVQSHLFNIDAVSVIDTLPANWTYDAGSTVITLPNLTTISGPGANPTVGLPTLTWGSGLLGSMLPHQQITIQFTARTTAAFASGAVTQNNVEAIGTRNVGGVLQTFKATDFVLNTYTDGSIDMQLTKASGIPLATPVSPGDTIPYTVTVTNPASATVNLTGVTLYDPMPAGVSYVASSGSVTCELARNFRDQFGTNGSYAGTNGTNTWASDWAETDNLGGGAGSGLASVTGNQMQLRWAENVRDEFATAAYTNQNGNANWSSNWTETDSQGGGATGGLVQVTGGVLRFQAAGGTVLATANDPFTTDNTYAGGSGWAAGWVEENDGGGTPYSSGTIRLSNGNNRLEFTQSQNNDAIRRQANAPVGTDTVTIDFDITDDGFEGGEAVIVEYDAGAGYQPIGTFDGGTGWGGGGDPRPFVISGFAGASITLRFRTSGNWSAADDVAGIDNVDISFAQSVAASGARIVRNASSLAGATSATLSFDYVAANLVSGDTILIQASSDGGTNFTTLETFNGTVGSSSRTYDLVSPTNYTANTAIRFNVTSGFGTTAKSFSVDNVNITYRRAATAVQRTANLTAVSGLAPALTFSSTAVNLEGGDQLLVQASTSAAGPFTTLATFTAGVPDMAQPYNLTPYISTTTTIRFVTSTGYDVTDEAMLLDNVDIGFGVSSTFASGNPPEFLASAAGCRIRPNNSLTLTFNATADNPFPVGQDEILNIVTSGANEIPVPLVASARNIVLVPGGQTATVGDRVWLDTDADGIFDAGETGIGGVEVTLKDQFGTPLQVTTTDSQGRYIFIDVPVGNGYYVAITNGLPSGLTQTSYKIGDSFDTNGVFNGSNATPNWLTPWSENNDDANAAGGDIQIANNRIEFRDTTDGGTVVTGESIQRSATATGATSIQVEYSWDSVGLETDNTDNIIVEYSTDGTTWNTLRTLNGNAAATFVDNLAWNPANSTFFLRYRAEDAIEAGEQARIDNVQIRLAQPLHTPTFNLTAGQDYIDADLGFRANPGTATIGDLVWVDANNDQVRNPGEVGLAGITVQIYQDLDGDGVLDVGEPLVTSQVTGPGGAYLFTGLTANGTNDYIVTMNTGQSGLTGYTATTNTLFYYPNLPSGAVRTDADFGFRQTSPGTTFTITDAVWLDNGAGGPPTNASNGLIDGTEAGIAGVTVDLLDSSGNTIASTITGSNGKFSFTGVPGGTCPSVCLNYSWRITDDAHLLDDYFGTTTSALTSIFQMTGSLSADLDFTAMPPVPGPVDARHFGYNQTRSIGDTVWNDYQGVTANGIQDPGEPGIGGVTVLLYRNDDGDAEFEPGVGAGLDGNPIATQVTDSAGHYLFAGLPPGSYWVSISSGQSALSGLTRTTADDDTTAAAGEQRLVTPFTTTNRLDIDFGYRAGTPFSITGRLFNDINRSGADDSEAGFSGIAVDLLNASGVVIGSTTTNGSGGYSFPGLAAGTYTVRVNDLNGLLAGYETTYEKTELGLAAAYNGQETVTLGPNATLVDFGYYSGNKLVTRAVISSFRARDLAGATVLEWTTASEIGTVGFYVKRWDARKTQYVDVNQKLLPALITAPQGGRYRYVDRDAVPGQRSRYLLIEIETSGMRLSYGPYESAANGEAVDAELDAAALADTALQEHGYSMTPHRESAERRVERASAAAADQARAVSRRSANAAKIGVPATGIYYVSLQDLQAQGGVNVPANWLAKYGLTNRGKSVAFAPSADFNGLLFYGRGPTASVERENVYRLSDRGTRGLLMRARSNPNAPPPSGAESYIKTLHVEQDVIGANNVYSDPDADFWVWDFVFAGNGAKTFAFRTDGAVRAGPASLTVRLKGGSETIADPDHHASFSVNGSLVGDARWNGLDGIEKTLAFDSSLLVDGENTLTIDGLTDTEAAYSFFYVESFDVRYASHYRAHGNRAECPASGNRSVLISGFTRSDIAVFDITVPARPVIVQTSAVQTGDGTYGVVVASNNPQAVYYAVAPDGVASASRILPDMPSTLKQAGNRGEYLVITTESLKDTAQTLADHRSDMESQVVDIEDVYDEFNFGIPSPYALKSFLATARSKWRTRPRYVLLAGDGTYDYRNAQGFGDNLIPPMTASTPSGLFPSDAWFVATKKAAQDEVSIGRLPVTTTTELADVIHKIQVREGALEDPWARSALLVADDADTGGDFVASSEGVASVVPNGTPLTRAYISQDGAPGARTKLLDGINQGTGIVSYIGHAGFDLLAVESLLTSADIATLTNAQRPTVMTAMTCLAGSSGLPGYSTVGELLLRQPEGGAAALWAPSGMSENDLAEPLAEGFYAAWFSGQGDRIGDAVVATRSAYKAGGLPAWMLAIYNLLGDPAMRVR